MDGKIFMDIIITNTSGIGRDTIITDEQSNQMVGGVMEIEEIKINKITTDELITVTLTIHPSKIFLHAHNVIFQSWCPYCGHTIGGQEHDRSHTH